MPYSYLHLNTINIIKSLISHLHSLFTVVSNSMRKLSTTTNVLAEPENLPEEIYRRVTKQEGERYPTSR